MTHRDDDTHQPVRAFFGALWINDWVDALVALLFLIVFTVLIVMWLS